MAEFESADLQNSMDVVFCSKWKRDW